MPHGILHRLAFPALGLALFALVALPPAAAQDPKGPPGCVQSNPCDFIVVVDNVGIADVSVTEFTTGEWVVATAYNHDEDAAHTLTLSGHSLSLTVPKGEAVEHSPAFRMGAPGTYELKDQPTGDTAVIMVMGEESFSDSASGGNSGKTGAPGPAAVSLMVGLAAAVALARRRV